MYCGKSLEIHNSNGTMYNIVECKNKDHHFEISAEYLFEDEYSLESYFDKYGVVSIINSYTHFVYDKMEIEVLVDNFELWVRARKINNFELYVDLFDERTSNLDQVIKKQTEKQKLVTLYKGESLNIDFSYDGLINLINTVMVL